MFVRTSWIALLTGAQLTFGLPSHTNGQALTRYVLQTDRVLTDEATASGLSYVSHVAVSRSGTVFVLDYRARTVEVLTPQANVWLLPVAPAVVRVSFARWDPWDSPAADSG